MEIADVPELAAGIAPARPVIDPASIPEQCVIRVSGQDMEVSAIFRTWIVEPAKKSRRAKSHR